MATASRRRLAALFGSGILKDLLEGVAGFAWTVAEALVFLTCRAPFGHSSERTPKMPRDCDRLGRPLRRPVSHLCYILFQGANDSWHDQ
ncbi:MAG: hypothetical protein ACKN9U_14845 [Pirellulaceae bacterium]